jgi:hypothetical protein
MAAAWSIAAYAQEPATMPATSGTTASLPQIEVARVKPVDQVLPNVRLSDDVIDLMKAFSLSSAEGIGGAWGAPLRPPTPSTNVSATGKLAYGRSSRRRDRDRHGDRMI